MNNFFLEQLGGLSMGYPLTPAQVSLAGDVRAAKDKHGEVTSGSVPHRQQPPKKRQPTQESPPRAATKQ
ncbi:MAG: hypothetical protein WDZ79_02970 [Candidatus Paceibacterota bacterium]